MVNYGSFNKFGFGEVDREVKTDEVTLTDLLGDFLGSIEELLGTSRNTKSGRGVDSGRSLAKSYDFFLSSLRVVLVNEKV